MYNNYKIRYKASKSSIITDIFNNLFSPKLMDDFTLEILLGKDG